MIIRIIIIIIIIINTYFLYASIYALLITDMNKFVTIHNPTTQKLSSALVKLNLVGLYT